MATFNISGCCTMRDAFGFQNVCKHDVIHFLQFTSPVTWFNYITAPEKVFSIDELDDLLVDGAIKNNFTKKCIINDYNRSVLSYFEKKADYFIFDFPEMVRYGLIKQIMDDNRIHYFTATGRVTKRNSQHKNFLDLLSGEKEIIPVNEYLSNELISEVMDKLYNWLCVTKGYACKEIILVRTVNALDYYDGSIMLSFANRDILEKENELLEKIYDSFENRFEGCNVVKFPHNAYGVIPHKWGLLSLHFCDEIYGYLYAAFDLIANKCSAGLDHLYDVTEKLLETNREKYALREKCFMLESKAARINYMSEKFMDTINGSLILKVDVHFSKIGWKTDIWEDDLYKYDYKYQIEALKIACLDKEFVGDIFYAAKVGYRKDWTNTYKNGQMVGTTGKGMPINALKIWLDKDSENKFEICYKLITNRGAIYESCNGTPIEVGKDEVFAGIYIELKKVNRFT